MKCPRCGGEASGKFCSSCGAALAGNVCPSCGAALHGGARFCHVCGAPTTGGPSVSPRANMLPWAVAGVAIVALLVVLALTRMDRGPTVQSPPAAAVTPGAPPDISQMTPRQRADALFNRVMTAAESGDQQTVAGFAPMALEAYRLIGPLDIDARYHIGLLHLVSGAHDAALAQADTIMQVVPQHLYGLILRADVARERGDAAALAAARRAFVEAYDSERAADRPEYAEHARMLDRFHTDALQALGRSADN